MIMSLATTTKKSRELHTNVDRDQYYQSSGTMTHKMEANFFLSSPIAQKQQGGSFFPSLSLSLHAPGAAFCIRRIPGKLMHYLLG